MIGALQRVRHATGQVRAAALPERTDVERDVGLQIDLGDLPELSSYPTDRMPLLGVQGLRVRGSAGPRLVYKAALDLFS